MITLVTRPERQGRDLARGLELRGYTPLFEPLLTIRSTLLGVNSFSRHSAIIVTSANAVSLLVGAGAHTNTPIFAVGPDTAAEATAFGFTTVHVAGGTAVSLLRLVRQRWAQDQGTLAYASGMDITCDAAAELRADGYDAVRIVVYDATPRSSLTEAAISAFQNNMLHSVVLMSTRTARIFGSLVAQHQLAERLSSVTAFVISQKVADAVDTTSWKNVRVADDPSRTGMFSLMNSRS